MIIARRRLFFLTLSVSALLSGFSASAQFPVPGSAKPPAAVVEINTEKLKVLLRQETSQPLLINFWATWCDPCRDEFPELVKIDEQYRQKGLHFIAISLDDLKDINTEVPKFLREMGARMPSYLLNVPDPEPAIKAVDPEWGGALPATFLYNQKGELVFKHFGRVKPDELRAAIEKVMSNER